PLFAAKGDGARLYAFAADQADTLRWMPCTCGCVNFGHTSNRSCYVKAEAAGRVTFTSPAATCTVCLDITRDVMRMKGEGKPLTAIRAAIDEKYLRVGP